VIQFASIENRNETYFVDWHSILGGGKVTVPCKDFDDAIKYARSLPDVTVNINCEIPERMTADTRAYVQSGVKA
jgi:hypothetical protein